MKPAHHRVAEAMGYTVSAFLALTAIGLGHHAYWPSTAGTVLLSLLALPPLWRVLLARIGAPAPAVGVYILLIAGGFAGLVALAEAERERRHARYWDNREAIVERVHEALAEGRFERLRALVARYRHVGAHELIALAERAGEGAGGDGATARPGNGNTDPDREETLREKLERQNEGLEELR